MQSRTRGSDRHKARHIWCFGRSFSGARHILQFIEGRSKQAEYPTDSARTTVQIVNLEDHFLTPDLAIAVAVVVYRVIKVWEKV